ncbi:MAG: YdeI/OmpD-associated family protein [Clostridia bacterium]|nr:YdeI/OmpD-associated family protein [Clostridia bacterium]
MNTFYAQTREEWRAWLEANFEREREIWFVFPMKASGEIGVSYNDAVEEALCFGWIDSIARYLDEFHSARRFTPRKQGSPYSRPNVERLIWLESRKMLHPSVRESVLDLIRAPYVFPEDILESIKKDAEAWRHYQTFSEPYKRIRIAYIDASRKRPAEFQKRLESFLRKTRTGKRIVGYGGIEKYYSMEPYTTE